MALDHALAELTGDGEGVLRLYGWRCPTVSLGRHEPAAGLYDLEAARHRGVGFVRRPTGGRAVLHHHELTYSIAAPATAMGGPRHAYSAINRALAEAITAQGAAVHRATDRGGRARPLSPGPCFDEPAPGEILADGRKLVGSAQARIGRNLLQHGSILLDGSQDRLIELGRRSFTVGRPAALSEFVLDCDIHALRRSVARAMGNRLGGSWSEGRYRDRETRRAAELVRERYGQSDWTWRR